MYGESRSMSDEVWVISSDHSIVIRCERSILCVSFTADISQK